jgi:hypothetical protein
VLDAVRRDLARLDAAAVRTHLIHTRHHEKQIRARR